MTHWGLRGLPSIPRFISSPDLVGPFLDILLPSLAATHEPYYEAHEEEEEKQGAQDSSDDDRHLVVSCGCKRDGFENAERATELARCPKWNIMIDLRARGLGGGS